MRVRLINADGSEAEISGNGTRCVAAYMVSNGHAGKLAIRTGRRREALRAGGARQATL